VRGGGAEPSTAASGLHNGSAPPSAIPPLIKIDSANLAQAGLPQADVQQSNRGLAQPPPLQPISGQGGSSISAVSPAPHPGTIWIRNCAILSRSNDGHSYLFSMCLL